MSKTSEPSPGRMALRVCVLAGLALGLILSMAPGSDLDFDGSPEPDETDDLIAGPTIPFLLMPSLLRCTQPRDYLGHVQSFSRRLVRPLIV